MTIFPIPKKLTYQNGACPASAETVRVTDASLKQEEYLIEITPAGIKLTAATDEGFFRAQTTLKQIYGQCGGDLPCLILHDWPDYPVRGLWHNCSGRLPTMPEFKRQLDLMANMKINHVEFELGTGNYKFNSFPQVRTGANPFTADEIAELSAYAKERFIDLVPCMQTFGHVNDWLTYPEFNEFAECPDGFEQWGSHQTAGTLDPLDPRSQAFTRKRLDDALDGFKDATTFNIGCDETWELGQGKSREACEKYGKTRVFLDFVTQTIDYLLSKGIRPIFWADIILQGSQEVLNAMPKESVALNWGYERFEVSEDSCIRLEKTGVPYWNCPGTSVWNSLLGQSYKAIQNIARCAVLGKRHSASGLLNTDWPDDNLHHFSPSYFGIAYGAAQGWTVAESDWKPESGEEEEKALWEPDAAQIVKTSETVAACFDYLNRFVYKDTREKMAQVAYDAGLYGHISCHNGIHNSTNVKRVLVTDKGVYGYDLQDFMDTEDYLEVIRFRLEHETRMTCDDAAWIMDEYADSIDMLIYACQVGAFRCGDTEGRTNAEFAALMRSRAKDVLRRHNLVWFRRNRVHENGAARYFKQFDEM